MLLSSGDTAHMPIAVSRKRWVVEKQTTRRPVPPAQAERSSWPS